MKQEFIHSLMVIAAVLGIVGFFLQYKIVIVQKSNAEASKSAVAIQS